MTRGIVSSVFFLCCESTDRCNASASCSIDVDFAEPTRTVSAAFSDYMLAPFLKRTALLFSMIFFRASSISALTTVSLRYGRMHFCDDFL